MTTYALSLLTDRKFLIKIDKPCKLELFLEPNEFNWSYDILDKNQSLSTYKLFIYRDYDFVTGSFLKTNFLNFSTDVDLIIVRVGLNLVKHLTLNKLHHEKILQLGYKIEDFNLEKQLYGWYKKLFKFNSYLDIKYANILKTAKPNSDTKVICAQIRIGSETDFLFTYRNSTQNYWKFIRNNFIKDLTNYKIFITTDVSEVFDEAKVEFGSSKIVGFKSHSAHVDFIKTVNDMKKCNEISEIFLDFSFLGKCDMGVISQSGFGLYGILNRDFKDFKNFYVYTNPNNIGKNFWNERKDLKFVKFNVSLLYLEDISNGIILN